MRMTMTQKKEYIEKFVDSGKSIELVAWAELGYNSPMSARASFNTALKRNPYNCHLITKGLKVYLLTDDFYNFYISNEEYWKKFKQWLLQINECEHSILNRSPNTLNIPRDMFPKMGSVNLLFQLRNIVQECPYLHLVINVNKDYVSIWK